VRSKLGRKDVPHQLLFLDECLPERIGSPEVDEVDLALEFFRRFPPGEVLCPSAPWQRLEPDDGSRESGPHRGGEDVDRACGQEAHEHGPTDPDRVQHGHEVGHAGLERRQVDVPTGQPEPPRIVRDHPGERAQFAQPSPEEGGFPFEVDVARPIGLTDDVDRTVSVDPIPEVDAVVGLRVAERRVRRHVPILPLRSPARNSPQAERRACCLIGSA
jgi:hypothetical protein